MEQNLEKKYAKGSVNIDGIQVETYKTGFESCNIIDVEAGSTGYRGGDSGHGGRTYLSITDLASTDLRCRVRNNGKEYCFDDVNEVEIILGGDSELDTFYEALCFGVEVLSKHSRGVDEPPMVPHKEMQQTNFYLYINELCEHYRKSKSLKGKGKLRDKYHVAGISIQQFFECELHKAKGHVSQVFCNKVYEYVLDRQLNGIEAPRFSEI